MSRRRRRQRERQRAILSPPERPHRPNNVYINTTLTARTPNQKRYIKSVHHNKLTICVGPAGTGKTFIPVAMALLGLKDGLYEKVVITRPMIEAGRKTGYLPGDINNKMRPYLKPIYEEMTHFVEMSTVKTWIESEKIEIVPLEYMRGRNFHQCFIIADEIQNADKKQLKMLITRYGKESKMVISGDFTQTDLPEYRAGALKWLVDSIIPRMIARGSLTGFVELDNSDIVREALVEEFVNAVQEFENEEKAPEKFGH